MIATLIEDLKARDIRLSINEGTLSCSAPPGALTPELTKRIKAAKAELIEMMTAMAESITLAVPIKHIPNQETYPLSSAQHRSSMTAHAGATLPIVLRLTGPLDVTILNKTLNHFVERHAPLHTRFALNCNNPHQVVGDHQRFEIHVIQIEDMAGDKLKDTIERLSKKGVNLEEGISFHFELLVLSATEHILFAAFSPFVFDGWSFDLFWRELTEGYAAFAEGKDWPFEPLEFTYADCTSWLTNRIQQREEDLKYFWHDQLGTTLPLDVFPLAGRPTRNQATSTLPFNLDQETTQIVRALVTKEGLTPQAILLAGIYIWSYRLRGIVDPMPKEPSALDVVIGIAVENRPHAALEKVVGPFANLILLREDIPRDLNFIDFVKRVQNDLLRAHQHQELPMERHQIRSRAGSTRSFQIEFSFQQATGRNNNMGPLRIEQLESTSGASAVDLTFWVKDWGKRIAGAIEFRVDSFGKIEVEQWIGCYHFLLVNMLKEPDKPIFEHEILNKIEVDRVVKATPEGVPSIMDEQGRILPFGVPGKISGGNELFILSSKAGLKSYTSQHIEPEAADTEYKWPITDTEVRLEILLTEILGQRIGIQADFFTSGLNSLLALVFIERCQGELGIPISVPILFENPSIKELSAYLENGDIAADAKMLVPLQPKGDQTPLYCICGINLYRRLAIALGEKQPTFAIYVPEERNLLGDKNSMSTGDLAKIYWQAIRKQHNAGPLRLLGFCFGGALAYEIIHLAQTEGFEVEYLVLIDTAVSKLMTRSLPGKVTRLLPESVRKKVKHITEIGKTAAIEVSEKTEISDNVRQVLSTRLNSYVPQKQYEGTTIIIDSGDIELYAGWKKTDQVGWEGTLTGAIHHIHLSTQHGTVLSAPNTDTIAEMLLATFTDTEN